MFPSDEEIKKELFEYLKINKKCTTGEAYEYLGEFFNLSDEDRMRKTNEDKNGRTENLFENKIRWARQRLVTDGIVDGSQHGIWKIIEEAELREINPMNSNSDIRKSLNINGVEKIKEMEGGVVKSEDSTKFEITKLQKSNLLITKKIKTLTSLVIVGFIILLVLQILDLLYN